MVIGEQDNPPSGSTELFNLPTSAGPEGASYPFTSGDIVAAGDLDGDGVPEIIIANGSGGGIQIFRSTGPAEVSPAEFGLPGLAVLGFGASIAVGDVNGDGFGDVVVGNPPLPGESGSGFVQVYFSHNAASVPLVSKLAMTFGDTGQVPFLVAGLGGPGTSPQASFEFPTGSSLAVCDVDHDGMDEIIVMPGGFQKVACADLNNDGFDDVIVTSPGQLEGNPPSVGLGGLNGYTLQGSVASYFEGNGEVSISSDSEIAAGDLDGDGFAEVLVGTEVSEGTGSVVVLSAPGKPRLPRPAVDWLIGDKLAIPHVIVPLQPPTVENATVPYVLEFIMYQPPGDKSSVTYGMSNGIGSNTTWSTTVSSTVSGNVTGIGGTPFGVGISMTTTNSKGGGFSTTTTTGETLTMSVASGSPDNPDHLQDQFWIVFGSPATITDNHNGQPPIVSINMATPPAVLNRLTGGQLQGIAEGDLSRITDPTLSGLVQQFIGPSDALQILGADPYFKGSQIDPNACNNIAQDSGRYTPGSPATSQFFGPSVKGEDVDSNGFTESVANGNSTSNGSAQSYSMTISGAIPMVGGVSTTYGISYSNSTTNTTTTTTSAGLSFGSDNVCVQGVVNIYLDTFFGTFLTCPQLTNPCAQQPLETMSFESLGDWQVQDGGVVALSGQAANEAEAFSIRAAPGGWTPIVSNPLSSTLLRGAAKSSNLSQVSFALNIPTTQPNPYWVGDAQMFISSPSANVFNAPLGEVNLTGLPEGQYNRIEFTIPSYALPAITGDNPDVTFTIVLNVNAGTSGWLVDDLEIGE